MPIYAPTNVPFAQRANHFDALRHGGILFRAVLGNGQHRDHRLVQSIVNNPHDRYLATATDAASFAARADDIAEAMANSAEALTQTAHMLRDKAQSLLVESEINIAQVPTVQHYLKHAFRWSPYPPAGRRRPLR